MKQAIVVTGTPGTGKTKLSKKLAIDYNLVYMDVSALIKKNALHEGYDRSLKTYLVNVNRLVDFLIDLITRSKKRLIIDSHLSHYIPKRYVKKCFVTTCDLPALKRRLIRRKYSKKKIQENLDAEIFQVCYVEAVVNKHNVKRVDTTKGLKVPKRL